ncbi:MAG: hypothetical protein EBV86_02165 [Marivivens sp.]|nr:hypothetical protein [Marivivens sp.]
MTPAPDTRNRSSQQLLRDGLFPSSWAIVPAVGKNPNYSGWNKTRLTSEKAIALMCERTDLYNAGVATGEWSKGLIALDIDGPAADARYKAAVGDEYQAYGEEDTVSWTSGLPGRRQLLYRIEDQQLVQELSNLKKAFLDLSGDWRDGEPNRNQDFPSGPSAAEGTDYEEVVLRFNGCHSLLPGSVHPETKKKYYYLNFNDNKTAPAPKWMIQALQAFRKAQIWLPTEEIERFQSEETLAPTNVIRGWFFNEKNEAMRLLHPRLEELVFNHERFGDWQDRGGSTPQRMNYCPWHGGQSGTSFQYQVDSPQGLWHCKGCGVGGDVLDYIYRIEKDDIYAGRPGGADLERIVANLCDKLGINYQEEIQTKHVVNEPRVKITSHQFFERLGEIYDNERNPAVRLDSMQQLAADTGRRMTGKECEAALGEYRYKLTADLQNSNKSWFENVPQLDFIVPNLLARPGQIVLHAAGGVGKTSACMGLARAVGQGLPMKVRGIEVDVVQGPVLWINSDQPLSRLMRDLEDNEIDPAAPWFHVRKGFQINHLTEFAQWVRDIRPVLVIVDSIGSCSSRMQVSEIEKAFATPLYHYNELNGDPGEMGFPPTTIIWIHHDNSNGEIRGNRYLVNAVDEQWHLRRLSDEEKDQFRERGQDPASVRMIQIKKSRAGREGDLLKVTRDADMRYSVEDYTPTVRRSDEGQGDPEPITMVLDIVVKGCEALEGQEEALDGMTTKQVWIELGKQLHGLAGSRAQIPSERSVKRWLMRWVEDGLLKQGLAPSRSGGGRPALLFRPSRACALRSKSVSVTKTPSDPLQDKGSTFGQGNEVSITPDPFFTEPDQDLNRSKSNWTPEESVQKQNPVVDSDLEGFRKKTPISHTPRTHARGGEGTVDVNEAARQKPKPTELGAFLRELGDIDPFIGLHQALEGFSDDDSVSES